MKSFFVYETLIGKVTITEENQAISSVSFGSKCTGENKATPLIKEAAKQLLEYFDGKRKKFDLPLKPNGTIFQLKVWEALQKIPYGETKTYGQIAEEVGNKKAMRAVGGANNKNPIAIIVPCHRVIGTNGKLVGYAGGLDIKEKLLNLEKGSN